MWWYLIKQQDDEDQIVYAYGRETREVTGFVRYDKHTGEITCLQLAEGDTQRSVERFFVHVWSTIKNGAPDTRQVAIGQRNETPASSRERLFFSAITDELRLYKGYKAWKICPSKRKGAITKAPTPAYVE